MTQTERERLATLILKQTGLEPYVYNVSAWYEDAPWAGLLLERGSLPFRGFLDRDTFERVAAAAHSCVYGTSAEDALIRLARAVGVAVPEPGGVVSRADGVN